MNSNVFKLLLIFFFLLLSICNSQGQSEDSSRAEKKWFIVLPLRFTQLQSHNTMLSGIKIGRRLSPAFSVSVSVYHSFYLTGFKAQANLEGFDKQPRLFINGMGAEAEYYFIRKKRFAGSLQLLLGWGFLKYDLNDHHFKSKQVNYVAVEPVLNAEYQLNTATYLGLGIGYRPISSSKPIAYSSDISDGTIAVDKNFPNGMNIILTLKGFL